MIWPLKEARMDLPQWTTFWHLFAIQINEMSKGDRIWMLW